MKNSDHKMVITTIELMKPNITIDDKEMVYSRLLNEPNMK